MLPFLFFQHTLRKTKQMVSHAAGFLLCPFVLFGSVSTFCTSPASAPARSIPFTASFNAAHTSPTLQKCSHCDARCFVHITLALSLSCMLFFFRWQSRNMQARTCKLIGITHEGEPFGAIKYAASNNHLISVAKSPGSDEHRAMVQEAQWMDAMLTALFKEGKIIYTGVKKHQLALETIWWLCLFYFPAFRTRWQQDEQTSNGMARKVQDFTPKFNTLLISEAISYPHWSCTDMEVVRQMYTKKAMLSCVVLDSGINVDDLRRNAYAAVSAAHLDRSTVIVSGCCNLKC